MTGKERPGVRGPGGPPKPTSPAQPGARAARTAPRQQLERTSYRPLLVLNRMPRWLLVVVMATLLFLGMIQTGQWLWFGALCLALVGLFLAWLLALAWPVLNPASRSCRIAAVAAVLGLAVLKGMGRL